MLFFVAYALPHRLLSKSKSNACGEILILNQNNNVDEKFDRNAEENNKREENSLQLLRNAQNLFRLRRFVAPSFRWCQLIFYAETFAGSCCRVAAGQTNTSETTREKC